MTDNNNNRIQFAFNTSQKKKMGLKPSSATKPTTAIAFSLPSTTAASIIAAGTKQPLTRKSVHLGDDDALSDEAPKRQKIVSIEDNQVLGDLDLKEKHKKPLVIPLPSRDQVAPSNITLSYPLATTDAVVKKEAKPSASGYSTQRYGLQVMPKSKPISQLQKPSETEHMPTAKPPTPDPLKTIDQQAIDALLNPDRSDRVIAPLLMPQQQYAGMSEDQKLQHDMRRMPDVASLEDYERVPVEEFGAALLRGMGWNDGEPLGRNGLKQPVEVKRRDALLGLGARASEMKELTHAKRKR